MKLMKKYTCICLIFVFLAACKNQGEPDYNYPRADETFQAIYKHYGIEGEYLLRETFPFDEKHAATYLASEEQNTNPYSYLWPFSGSLSAVTALYNIEKGSAYLTFLESKILPGLDMYYDTRRQPGAYASYINTAPLSDRFYDDNIWIGIDLADLYLLTKNKEYLDKAESVWKFIESGNDSILGGGIYWCEQKKLSKNACSNAPASVFALKLYEATKDESYMTKGKALYLWTKTNLQDTADYLYYDNVKLDGSIGKTKYAYNSGQMLQAGALLYKLTKKEVYLADARKTAQACYSFFFNGFQTEGRESFKLLKKGEIWFTAVMLRGFIELYNIDKNKEYINAFQKNLDYAWKYMRDEDGLFNSDWSGQTKDKSKWLLTQFAMAEMYARAAFINAEND